MVLGASTPIDRIGIFLGGMRCGSTATLDYMRQHPQACIHHIKDPHFFSGDANWTKGWDDYLKGWDHFDPARHRIAFESSTHYTKFPLYRDTAERMASSGFDMRLVYSVRGPLERMESHLVHNVGKGYLDPGDSNARSKLLKQAISVSNYDLQMQQYEAHFGRHQVHVIALDQLKREPQATLRRIFGFFGIDETFEVTVLPPRPRTFKTQVTDVSLTEEERAWASAQLLGPIRRFEERYGVRVWDGNAETKPSR
jgi:hypothetical protein